MRSLRQNAWSVSHDAERIKECNDRNSVNKQKQNKKKGKSMKTTRINTPARLTGLVIALALFAGVAGEVKAQYKAVGDDGIAASPRLRQMLNDRKGSAATVSPTVASMPCPKCKDVWVTSVDSFAKPAKVMMSGFKPTVSTVKHLCAGCETSIVRKGHGKQGKDEIVHVCRDGGAESLACCTTKKGSEVVTKGMEKKFEIAPLK